MSGTEDTPSQEDIDAPAILYGTLLDGFEIADINESQGIFHNECDLLLA